MRFRDPKRLRIISGASVLLLLIGAPTLVAVTRWAPDPGGEPPGVMFAYAQGLSSLGAAALASAILAAVFGFWLFVSQRRDVGRKWLQASSRRRRNLVEDARSIAIILGVSGLIIGSLAGVYAGMISARPDLAARLALPFLTPQLAFGGLIGGGLLYAAGRFGR